MYKVKYQRSKVKVTAKSNVLAAKTLYYTAMDRFSEFKLGMAS